MPPGLAVVRRTVHGCWTEARPVTMQVVVHCRPQDAGLLNLDTLSAKFKEATGREVKLSVEPSLASSSCGGVEMLSRRGKIRVCNTLESRLDMIALQLLPQIRTALFGRNPNRKFMD